MQDEISRKIAAALQVELTPSDERRKLAAAPPAGRAYAAYQKGRYHLFRESRNDVLAAIEAFEHARELDPGSALPLIGLSEAYTQMAFAYEPDGDWHERSEEVCAKALALAPELPEARYLRGRLLWTPRRGFDHAGALREFAAAIAGRPNLTEAYDRLAVVLLHISLIDEAVQEFRGALAIGPDDLVARTYRGMPLLFKGRYEESLADTRSVVTRRPAAWANYQIAQCLIRLGRREEAGEEVARLERAFPEEVLIYPLRGLLAASAGDRAGAHASIEETERHRKSYGHYHHAQYDTACILSLLGETEAAVGWLEQAAGNGFPCIDFFERDPLLANARKDARFPPLRDRLRAETDAYRRLYREHRVSRTGEPVSGPPTV